MGKRKSREDIERVVRELGYELVDYSRDSKSRLIVDVVCCEGHEYRTTFNNFKFGGKRCGKCSGGIVLTYEDVKSNIESYGYKLLSKEYVNAKTHLEIECDKGHKYLSIYDSFNRGSRCPCCSSSKGEEEVSRILDKYGIDYKRQHGFDGCRNINKLLFDFYIEDMNVVIEYDGIQHFEVVEAFGGEEALKHTQERDKIKNTYCLNNGINLIRIPYWEFEVIEQILVEKLNINMENIQRLSKPL